MAEPVFPPADSLFVQWRLLRSCNYDCSWCQAPRAEDNCVIIRSRVLAVAAAIYQRIRPGYVITLTGGEPTLHPFLPDIVRYFLTSRHNTWLTLETNGSQPPAYYMNLLQGSRPGRLRLSMTIHPAFSDLRHLLTLIASIVEQGHFVEAKLYEDSAHATQSAQFARALGGLRKSVSFDFRTVSIDHISESVPPAMEKEASEEIKAGFRRALAAQYTSCRSCAQEQRLPEQGQSKRFCCASANYLRIEPDGSYFDAPCLAAGRRPPLWRETEKSDAPYIVSCASLRCEAAKTTFPDRQKAEDWLKAWKARASEWKAVTPAGFDAAPASGPKINIISRLANMPPKGARKDALPDFLWKDSESICSVYEFLADAPSRDVFLRLIKKITTGNDACLAESPFPRHGHPEVPANEDDIIFSGGAGYCTLIQSGFTLDSPLCHAATAHRPKIQMRLPNKPEDMLRALCLFGEQLPFYRVFLGQHGKETWLYALPDTHRPHALWPGLVQKDIADTASISVILLAHDDGNNLKRAIDSVLIQRVPNLELILIDISSAGATPEIAGGYRRACPDIIKTLRLAGADAGWALNAGLDLSLGEYITIITANDMLDPNFLATASESARAGQADIMLGSAVIRENSEDRIFNAGELALSGWESLRAFLKVGFGGVAGMLFSRKLLASHNIRFGKGAHFEMFFAVPAFYHSHKTVAINAPGIYKDVKESPLWRAGASVWEDFVCCLGFLRQFFKDNNLPPDDGVLEGVLKRIYVADRKYLCAEIAETWARGDNFPGEKGLRILGESRTIISFILSDYGVLYCRASGLRPKALQNDCLEMPEIVYTPYGNAANPSGRTPILSVIMPNYNKIKYIGKSLRSILDQSMPDYELIIMDDASSDGSECLLQEYADCDPRIRLFRMAGNVRQGICRNIGMDMARGKYFIFVDSDDICMPRFFQEAVNAIAKTGADAVLFSSTQIDANGALLWEDRMEDGFISLDERMAAFFEGRLQAAPWAKIFSAAAVKMSGARFEEYLYHQDVPFFAAVLGRGGKIATRKFVAYAMVQSFDSAIRPAAASYLHIHSAVKFYQLVHDIILKYAGEKRLRQNPAAFIEQIRWNIENVLLEKTEAFRHAAGSIPFTQQDFQLLAQNWLFAYALLLGFAGRLAEDARSEKELPTRRILVVKPKHFTPLGKPVVSVILAVKKRTGRLRACLDSLLSQSLRQMEVLVANDGQDAEAGSICQAYAAGDPRVRLLEDGSSPARAIAMAEGEYLAFMTPSDIAMPDFLLHGASRLTCSPAAAFIQFGAGASADAETGGPGAMADGELLLRFFCEKMNSCGHSQGKIFRRSAFRNIGLSGVPAEDLVFLLEAYSKSAILENGAAFIQQEYEPGQQALSAPKDLFAACAAISRYCRQSLRDNLAEELVERFYSARRGKFLEFLASYAGAAISPLSARDMGDLIETPELFNILFEDYAALYARRSYSENKYVYVKDAPASSIQPRLLPVTGKPQKGTDLSIVLYARNAADTLEDTVLSILNQNIENIEILLVEDCSDADDTFAMCMGFASGNPHVRLMRSNMPIGRGKMFNLAMTSASGEYITFPDGACRFVPGFLQLALERVGGFDVASCNIASVNANGEQRADMCSTELQTPAEALAEMSERVYQGVADRIFRTKFLLDNGISFGDGPLGYLPFLAKALALCGEARCFDLDACLLLPDNPGRGVYSDCQFNWDIANISSLASIINTNFDGQTSDMINCKFAKRILADDNIFKSNFLRFINYCCENKLTSPLNNKSMKMLANARQFITMLLIDYAVLAIGN